MDKKQQSLIEEINNFIPKRHLPNWAETQGDHLINATIRLFEELGKVYDQEVLEKLERRMFLSIRNRDPQKFKNTIKTLQGTSEEGEYE